MKSIEEMLLLQRMNRLSNEKEILRKWSFKAGIELAHYI